ncbi:MAG: regulatory protein RecX [Gammaproteobacteria bacterium]|nr:regulatory protein RecX [Gammaproteobacteria bacterium]
MEQNAFKIRETALRLLTRREHSTYELSSKLALRGFETSEINPVIQTLIQQGLLSDERFVENYIRMRVRLGFGPVKIQHELTLHHLDFALINKYLNNYADEWLDLAETARIKHFGGKIPSDYKTYAKQAHFLQYRGFTHDQINTVLPYKKSL